MVGIVAKSGTLSYEAVGATTRAGLGQSIVVGMGGDMLPGTTQVDGLKLFVDHEDTKGIVVIGEIGGEAELNAAEFIRNYRANTANPKPIVALVTGRTAPEGKTMGESAKQQTVTAYAFMSQWTVLTLCQRQKGTLGLCYRLEMRLRRKKHKSLR